MDLIEIHRAFHPKATEYTFFSSAHGTFSKIDHTLGYKSNLSNFKKNEIISSIFSHHNAIGLEINYKGVKKQKQNKTQHNKKHKHKLLEAKQYATKQPMDH